MSLILRAARFARAAHEHQRRKWSEDAYVLHPGRVASRVSLLDGVSEDMVAAAWLHDVLEDTNALPSDLISVFGDKITKMVIALTNKSMGSKLLRAERKKIDREHLAMQSPEVKKIKMLDRIDNLRDIAGATDKFKYLYANESFLLVGAVGDADEVLKDELVFWAEKMEREAIPKKGIDKIKEKRNGPK